MRIVGKTVPDEVVHCKDTLLVEVDVTETTGADGAAMIATRSARRSASTNEVRCIAMFPCKYW
jgi:hypothetical protein